MLFIHPVEFHTLGKSMTRSMTSGQAGFRGSRKNIMKPPCVFVLLYALLEGYLKTGYMHSAQIGG